MNPYAATARERRASWLCLSVSMAIFASSAAAQTTARYRVVDLGTPPSSSATALSDQGHVAGLYFGPAGHRRGFVWEAGNFTDIGTLGGMVHANAVNGAGTVVGMSVDHTGRQCAVRVENGIMLDLGNLHNGTYADASDINSAGWIVGISERQFGSDRYQRPALWRNGTVIDLGTFGGEYGAAHAVNDAGQVVGWAWTPLPARHQRAFLWSDATGMVDLGTLGHTTATAADINDHGAVVGASRTADPSHPTHAFLWTAQSGMIDLGVPPGALESYAAAINNHGQIVGNSFLPVECRTEPLLWDHGSLHLVNDLIDPAGGWIVVQAQDISDQGVIAANARKATGPYRAVLLVPQKRATSIAQPAPR